MPGPRSHPSGRRPCPPTPPQTAGPFYPLALPPESDNDLVQIVGRAETAKGTVTYLSGHVLDPTGRRISGDANGRYHYVRDDRADRPLDEYFQGYGQTATDGTGGYRLRTIRPVPYPGRTPHIHFTVSAGELPRFVTQMYVAGEPGNEHDGRVYERARSRGPSPADRVLAAARKEKPTLSPALSTLC